MAQKIYHDSLKLDRIRMEKRRVEEIVDLVQIVEDLIQSGNLDINSYEVLHQAILLWTTLIFMNFGHERAGAWTWPDMETLEPLL